METTEPQADSPRRATLGSVGQWSLFLALTAAYGTFAAFLGRFLFPSSGPARDWMYVTPLSRLAVGNSILFETPSGSRVNIARQASSDSEDAFIALSSTCPHLGCQVHWEPQKDRFFCPCHNGVFSPDGVGIDGPPGDAGQDLPRYPLRVEAGLLYIEVEAAEVAMGPGTIIEDPATPPGPGHDPCLYSCKVDFRERRA